MHTGVLLLPACSARSSPVRLLADLVDFERLGGRTAELFAGVSRIHIQVCVRGHH